MASLSLCVHPVDYRDRAPAAVAPSLWQLFPGLRLIANLLCRDEWAGLCLKVVVIDQHRGGRALRPTPTWTRIMLYARMMIRGICCTAYVNYKYWAKKFGWGEFRKKQVMWVLSFSLFKNYCPWLPLSAYTLFLLLTLTPLLQFLSVILYVTSAIRLYSSC